jgi:hypothetical protein
MIETEVPLEIPEENETESTLYLASPEEAREVMTMVLGGDDDDMEIFGRMPVGGDLDVSDFDEVMPTRAAEVLRALREEQWAKDHPDVKVEDVGPTKWAPGSFDELDMLSGEAPAPFQSPGEDQFPVFRGALRRFQADQSKPRVVRVDTVETHNDFVCEAAVRELVRRMDELEAALQRHEDDPYAHRRSRAEVLGAADAVADLHSVETADQAVEKMPTVPLSLPAFAEGAVKCWLDGERVICSIKFATPDGGRRTATMAAHPRIDVEGLVSGARRRGVDPIEVLGALPEVAATETGRRLVREVAGAALRLQEHPDVCGMEQDDEQAPLLLASHEKGDESSAPLAALMYLRQRAEQGDEQACRELEAIQRVACTPLGKKIAAPALAESERRLNQGRKEKGATLLGHYAKNAGWL